MTDADVTALVAAFIGGSIRLFQPRNEESFQDLHVGCAGKLEEITPDQMNKIADALGRPTKWSNLLLPQNSGWTRLVRALEIPTVPA
jgi:hypothetical protein